MSHTTHTCIVTRQRLATMVAALLCYQLHLDECTETGGANKFTLVATDNRAFDEEDSSTVGTFADVVKTTPPDAPFIPMDDIDPKLVHAWQYAVANGDTRLGVSEWIVHNEDVVDEDRTQHDWVESPI